MENSCRKKYRMSSKKWVLASCYTGFRRNPALIPANAGLFHYAGNNPVRYIDPDGREDAPYNMSWGKYDLLPTLKGIDTGDEWYNNLWDGFVCYCLEGTYNFCALSLNIVNNGVFSGIELFSRGIDWLDENWPNDCWSFTGNGFKADLKMFCFIGLANPQFTSAFFSQLKSSGSYLNVSVRSITNSNLKTIIELSKNIESELGVSLEAQELTFRCLSISSNNKNGLLMVSKAIEKMVSTGSISRKTLNEMNKFSGFLLQNVEKQEFVNSLKTLQDITGTLGGY